MEYISLEKPIADLDLKIDQLEQRSDAEVEDKAALLQQLRSRRAEETQKIFATLTVYQIVQMSRHPGRPTTLELVQMMADSFYECHGDRNFLEDPSVVGGLAHIGGRGCVVIGHQKGRSTKENIHRNFGMPKPEGYRKALRLMSLAERMGLPIVTLINTPGAYPGVAAEERGQSEAIGKNILVMCRLKVPIVSIVVGEGGSGGALALGVANRAYMLRYATYSVISPEGCASILFKNAKRAPEAAHALALTADSALRLGVIDGIIEEPEGGAHRNPMQVAGAIRAQILQDLEKFDSVDPSQLRAGRVERYLAVGSDFILNEEPRP